MSQFIGAILSGLAFVFIGVGGLSISVPPSLTVNQQWFAGGFILIGIIFIVSGVLTLRGK